MAKIMLNDMEFITKHGACPHEYEFDQKFKVDVFMYTDCVLEAGATDDLSLTIIMQMLTMWWQILCMAIM